MDIKVVHSLGVNFDIALFLDDDIEDDTKEFILNSNKKYISLTSKPSDIYEHIKHISSISFPLYCSKIKTSFDELLNPEDSSPHIYKSFMKFVGHVLVAEDNEANQELIKILLSKYGLTYDMAVNGLEAVSLYKQNSYDLILMDEQMPIMDGNVAVKNILKYELEHNIKHTPISALTANVIKGAKERGLSSGFDSFLGKPIIIKELERVFTKYLKTSKVEMIVSDIDVDYNKINGLNYTTLCQELMLEKDEVLMLVKLFIKKMKKQIPELDKAIDMKDYKKIAIISHSIKGSSGNFRMENLQEITSKMEEMAKNKDSSFDYIEQFKKLKNIVSEVYIK
jgi:CheY-like chemotaxis protein